MPPLSCGGGEEFAGQHGSQQSQHKNNRACQLRREPILRLLLTAPYFENVICSWDVIEASHIRDDCSKRVRFCSHSAGLSFLNLPRIAIGRSRQTPFSSYFNVSMWSKRQPERSN